MIEHTSATTAGRLPGDVPGLLARYSPVRWQRTRCVVLDVAEDQALVASPSFGHNPDGHWLPLRGLTLDLDHPAGRERAARWLAGYYALGPAVAGYMWCRVADDRPTGPIWLLARRLRGDVIRFTAEPPESSPVRSSYVPVPELAGVVDSVEALRLCARDTALKVGWTPGD